IPRSLFLCNALCKVLRHSESLQGFSKLHNCFACIGNHWQLSAVLVGIKGSDIDVDEGDIRVLECSARCGGEIAVASTDTDDHISVTRKAVSSQCSGCTHTTEVLCMIPRQHATTSLRGTHLNASLLHKCLQLLFRIGVLHSATS